MDKERFAILIAPFGLSTKRLSSDARRLSKFPGPAQNRLNRHNRVPDDIQTGGMAALAMGARRAGGRAVPIGRHQKKPARNSIRAGFSRF
jgi:hypothetical protein